MPRLIFAIALYMAVQAATAEAAPPVQGPNTSTAVAVAAAGVVQASLGLPEKEAKGTPSAKPAAVKTSLAAQDSKDGDDEQQPTTGGMLLAALAVMTAIALRRWGAGQQ
jgi:hypothetical protein